LRAALVADTGGRSRAIRVGVRQQVARGECARSPRPGRSPVQAGAERCDPRRAGGDRHGRRSATHR